MYKATPIAITVFNLEAFDLSIEPYLEILPSKMLDRHSIRPNNTEAWSFLAGFESRLEGKGLRHSFMSFFLLGPSPGFVHIVENTDLVISTQHKDPFGPMVGIVSGSVWDWRQAIYNCLCPATNCNYAARRLMTLVFDIIMTTNFDCIFSRYKKRRLPEDLLELE